MSLFDERLNAITRQCTTTIQTARLRHVPLTVLLDVVTTIDEMELVLAEVPSLKEVKAIERTLQFINAEILA